MVCQQLSVSRSQLHIWLKRDQLGFGLQTQPVRGREAVLHPAAKRVIKMGSKKRLQSTRKLSRRITKTSYKTSPGYSVIHTEADAKTIRKTTNPLPEVRARARALVRRGLTEGGRVGFVVCREPERISLYVALPPSRSQPIGSRKQLEPRSRSAVHRDENFVS